ncbi:MAG: hypothetical protein GKR93_01390 [Gammaproteobacteria bacterium]|nr:hypothetical protein [Gammaproteobacteria bacterium]
MKIYSKLKFLLGTLLVLLCTQTAEAVNMAPKLHFDPFETPEMPARQEIEEGKEIILEPLAWQPRLKAIMRSNRAVMVNIDGEIIGIGEELNGFRLLEVQERAATFEKNGKIFPVLLDDARDPELRERGR